MHWTIHNDTERDAVCKHIAALTIPAGKPYEVVVKRKTKRRTLRQNSLYWLYITALADWTGNDKDDLHEYFADKFLPHVDAEVFDKMVTKRISTTELDTAGFSQYIERMLIEAAHQGYPMPSPENPLFEQFREQFEGRIA